MERIASGYMLAEAPLAAADGGVFFSDALGGGVYRWSPGSGSFEVVIPKRRGVGGMAQHADGGLVVSGRDVSIVRNGETTLLYADEGAAGFNDLTTDPDGRVVAGALRFNPFAGEQLGDGTYGPPRVVVEGPGGDVDGMAVDENGPLWVALGARGSIGRFRPDGELDDELEVPAGFVASLCFGGSDRRDLFITTAGDPNDADGGGSVFLTRSPVAGVAQTTCTN